MQVSNRSREFFKNFDSTNEDGLKQTETCMFCKLQKNRATTTENSKMTKFESYIF